MVTCKNRVLDGLWYPGVARGGDTGDPAVGTSTGYVHHGDAGAFVDQVHHAELLLLFCDLTRTDGVLDYAESVGLQYTLCGVYCPVLGRGSVKKDP